MLFSSAFSKPTVYSCLVTTSTRGPIGAAKRHIQAQWLRRKHNNARDDFRQSRPDAQASRLDYDYDEMITATMPMRFSPTSELLGYPPNVDVDGQSECFISGHLMRKIVFTPGIGSPLPRAGPGVKSYRVTSVPNKGEGMLAARDISAGELVLAERPLLVVPIGVKMKTVRVLPSNGEPTSAQTTQVQEEDAEKFFALAVKRMKPRQREAFEKLESSHLREGCGPIEGRVRMNAFGFKELRDPPKNGKPGPNYGIVCEDLSRINHSCGPNTIQHWDMPSFSIQLRAVRDIEQGEEISVNYSEASLMASYAARQADLAPYGFRCDCPSCTNPKASDARRHQIRTMLQSRTKLAEQRSGAGPEEDSDTPVEELLDGLTLVQELLDGLKLIEKEGLEGTSGYGFMLTLVMSRYAADGDVAGMRVYARKFSVWRVATHREGAVDEEEVENGFGLLPLAELVQKMTTGESIL
ncbi:hypothetical protein EIP91_000324 [Steccherinum ochraceum]|uniref:SET domain-containing protein n=1 Tax=Steccherinum ochraceum TaxID=92696 RepID=A0A4V2MWR6_9APHY|nr:hypothetical protein EIP91_000324 [Steccherinum ochraceum]